MKFNSYILTVLLGAALFLAACGSDGAPESSVEAEETKETEVGSVEEVTAEVSIETAEAGDVVETEAGTYEIVKVAEEIDGLKTGPITYTIERAYLAKFTPNDFEAFLFEDEPNVDGSIHALVTVGVAENSGDEYVSFDPFFADVFVGGSKPYEAQMYLNEGDSDISAGKSQEFFTAYNLEDEALEEVTEVNVKQYGPSDGDYMRAGDDVEFTISFD